ncbi:DMT family transporter [Actinotalea sp. Marseille-Q4924]|uniref:DMT family transporter n=1 Tax=Actinotalea sp. Marseille-Q4924 TaxID=2866571 RepID=UPI001CE41450|nr:DMT family transporter [Actinotalea sp. Marseille-Q4924]
MTSTRRTGLLLALTTACISGVAVFLNGYGVRAFGDATAYTTAKNLVAALVLVGIVAAGGAGARLTRPTGRREWVGLGLVAVVGGSVPFVLFFEGLARASSSQSAVIHKTLLVWVALLAVPLLHEKLTAWHGLAFLLLVVAQVGLVGGVPSGMATGEVMILAATLLWSVEVVLAKRLLSGLSSWTLGVARMAGGSVVLVAWSATQGHLAGLGAVDAAGWGWVLLTGLILAGYVATWFGALARAQAVDVTAVLVLAVPITAVLAAVVDGTALRPQALWLLMVVAGAGLVSRQVWTRPTLPAVVPAT